MEALVDYIAGRASTVERETLHRIVARYGWFTTARRARALLLGMNDPALALPLGCRPTIPPVVVSERAQEVISGDSGEVTSFEESIIDRFLEHGGYRITPTEGDEVEDIAAVSAPAQGAIDPEIATPELAEIYRAQGHSELADEIYRILSSR